MAAPSFDQTRLASFLDAATSQDCVRHALSETGADLNRVTQLLSNYSAEVPIVLSLLEGGQLSGKRLLDVGAGIGLTSFFLAREGYSVTALEPGGTGFDLNQSLFLALRKYFGAENVPLLTIGAEGLNEIEHGNFDVMFSSNVLEHVSDLREVVRAMASVLSPDGYMVHTCPNYAFPYEPHYNLLLLPFIPSRTPWVGKKKTEEVWSGLNFVTVRTLEKHLIESGLEARFEKGTMARSIERLRLDPVFASRHKGLAAVARLMQATGALFALKRWPASFATPLRVSARRPSTSLHK